MRRDAGAAKGTPIATICNKTFLNTITAGIETANLNNGASAIISLYIDEYVPLISFICLLVKTVPFNVLVELLVTINTWHSKLN
ncbi:hypothetical protein JCM15415_19000 [Methanobacterium movens]